MAPRRDPKKRLGKKHRQASTRPKKGKAPRSSAVTGAVAPKARKKIASKKSAAEKAARTPRRSPDFERRETIAPDTPPARGRISPGGRKAPNSFTEADLDAQQWREAERIASDLDTAVSIAGSSVLRRRNQVGVGGALGVNPDLERDRSLPLVAICGRPNVGKSTLFNRLTGSRRSIVGDEPGITRDRIYGEVEWSGRDVRIVDTGGVVPDDEALIPSEIFRQAQVALEEADAIIMVVDGRTELASPDLELARLLLRGGKPCFLAVNKIDTAELQPSAENFRRLGFRNVLAISAEHGVGIGDLLDDVFSVLPGALEVEPDRMLGIEDEMLEDEDGPIDRPVLVEQGVDEDLGAPHPVLSSSKDLDSKTRDPATEPDAAETPTEADATTPSRKLRTHGEFLQTETKIAIIGRPNVGKSTLLNALTGTARAIVSPIAGTTRDAVDEVVERDGHSFRFVDTAGIRRKGKTKLMAEKLSVIMARKHLEAADVSLLVIDATEGVTALDANIGGYAHESGRSVIIVINKWDLVTTPDRSPGAEPNTRAFDGKLIADKKIFEEQVRHGLKYLDYAPLLFISAEKRINIKEVFKKVELVARERRKRITTGQMNRFLERVDFQKASVPMNKRVKIYYMTEAAVAPPTFVLFTDKDIKLHFAFERFLANQLREAFGFIGSPIWFKVRARNKKGQTE